MSPTSIIFTIGHSTRPLEQFTEILKAHEVRALADVRTVPRSRWVPQFNDDALAEALPKAGIEYHPFKSLGGWRKPKKDSINTGWQNSSFRGYADFMQMPAFATALDQLIELAGSKSTTTMCAEALPWRCHRSLISDALIARGWKVMDIMSAAEAVEHKLTPFAKVHGLQVIYPQEDLFSQ